LMHRNTRWAEGLGRDTGEMQADWLICLRFYETRGAAILEIERIFVESCCSRPNGANVDSEG